jgi:hypothetical protein
MPGVEFFTCPECEFPEQSWRSLWPSGGTYASAISADGSTIMGYGWVCQLGWTTCASSDMVQAYRWTVAGVKDSR